MPDLSLCHMLTEVDSPYTVMNITELNYNF